MTIGFDSQFFNSMLHLSAYLSPGTLIELLFHEIRIQNSLKCAFLVDKQRHLQFLCYFVLLGKNVALLSPLENFLVRQTMCDTLNVTFSKMAMDDQVIVNQQQQQHH